MWGFVPLSKTGALLDRLTHHRRRKPHPETLLARRQTQRQADVGFPRPGVFDKVRELACHLPDSEIADQLNREGQASAKGLPYTSKIIQWVRCRYRIPPAELKRPGELTVRQVAERFGTTRLFIIGSITA